MNLKPLANQVLVLRDAPADQTLSGIVLTADPAIVSDQGVILKIGPDVTELAVGERVLFGKYTGQSHSGNPREIFMREHEIFAVLEN